MAKACRDCTFLHYDPFIQIGDDEYMASITNTTNWYDGVFISYFSQLAAHYAHITKDEHPSLPSVVNLPLLIHITYPMEFLQEGQYKSVPQGVTRVVAITVYWRLTSLIRSLKFMMESTETSTDGWIMCLVLLSAACFVIYGLRICMLQMNQK